MILGKLALHYWRPDFTAEQAKLVMGDYLDDLEGYDAAHLQTACEIYRRGRGNEFFPKICQLLEVLNPPKAVWDSGRPRLPAYRTSDYLLDGPKAVRSVAEVLRQAGEGRAAEDWEAWKVARPNQ